VDISGSHNALYRTQCDRKDERNGKVEGITTLKVHFRYIRKSGFGGFVFQSSAHPKTIIANQYFPI